MRVSERVLPLLRDVRRARRRGSDVLIAQRRSRVAEQVAFARAHSPYLRELYAHLPARVEETELLPVTSKAELQTHFDDWVTDHEATIAAAREYSATPGTPGSRFLGRYVVCTSSGTTGRRGMALIDGRALAVGDALRLHSLAGRLGPRDLGRIAARRGAGVMVSSGGGHPLGAALAGAGRWRRRSMQVVSMYAPMEELVAELNRLRPVILSGYASVIAQLAGEQLAGRLRISPLLVAVSAEALAQGDQVRIKRAFGAKLANTYAAAECPFIAHGCKHGWLHLNSDWVVLEPVDAEGRPTLPGQESHSALLTNLANRVQPMLRYRLDDRVLTRPEPCPCGSALPAIRVRGRTAEPLLFESDRGEVGVLPIRLRGMIVRNPAIERFQLVQTTPTTLRVRFQVQSGAAPDDVWRSLHRDFGELFAEHGLGHVTMERGEEAPQRSPGGKYREIIPLPSPTEPVER